MDVFSTPQFLTITSEQFASILKDNQLVIGERELFDLYKKWESHAMQQIAQHYAPDTTSTTTTTTTTTVTSANELQQEMDALFQLIRYIRFPTMSAEELLTIEQEEQQNAKVAALVSEAFKIKVIRCIICYTI